MHGSRKAREVLKTPEAHSDDRLAFEDPGSYEQPENREQLEVLDDKIRRTQRKAEAYRQMEEMARLQVKERDARRGLAAIGEEEGPTEQTTWDRLQSRDEVEGGGQTTRIENKKASKENLREIYSQQAQQEAVEDVVGLVRETEQKKSAAEVMAEARSASKPNSNGGTTIIEESERLRDTLQDAYEESSLSREEVGEKTRQVAQQAEDGRALQAIERAGEREGAPGDLEEASELIKETRREGGGVNAGSMLKRGVEEKNEVLRQGARLDIKRDVEAWSKGANDRTRKGVAESIGAFQEMYNETKAEWQTRSEVEGIEREIRDRVERMTSSEREALEREASRGERAERALEIAQQDQQRIGGEYESEMESERQSPDRSNEGESSQEQTPERSRTQTRSRGRSR
jgi:hypothetical protein